MDRDSFLKEISSIFFLLVFSILFLLFAADSKISSKFLIVCLTLVSIYLFLKRISSFSTNKNFAEIAIIFGLIFWYLIPGIVNILINDELVSNEIGVNVENKIGLMVLASLVIFLFVWRISYYIFYKKNTQPLVIPANQYYKGAILISLIGCFIGLLPYLLGSGGIDNVIYSIFEGRAAEKEWLSKSNIGTERSAYIFVINSFLCASLSVIWLSLSGNKLKKKNRLFLLTLAFLLTAVIYFDQGTRSIMALVILPFIIIILIKKWESVKNSNVGKLKFGVVILVAVFISFLLFQFQMVYRLLYSRTDLESYLFANWLTMGGTSDFFSESVYAFSLVPKVHDYFHESAILQFIASPIPRFLWPSKPLPELVWYYSTQRWGIDIYEVGGNVFPGIIGWYYMSWGWLGIVSFSFLAGLISAKTDGVFSKLDFNNDTFRIGVWLMVVIWLFLSFRNLSPGFLYPVLFAFLILKFGTFLGKRYNFI